MITENNGPQKRGHESEAPFEQPADEGSAAEHLPRQPDQPIAPSRESATIPLVAHKDSRTINACILGPEPE
jgi:hypothetical protein